MRFHKIDIDDEVMEVLKKNAEPFEDTPNTVLRRLLLEETQRDSKAGKRQQEKSRGTGKSGGKKDSRGRRNQETKPLVKPDISDISSPVAMGESQGLDISKLNPLNFIGSAPKSLEQILEVIYQVRVLGYARAQATIHVAQKRHIKPRTVVDKYCGELGKKAEEIDELLAEPQLSGFRDLLKKRFGRNKEIIDEFFRRLLDTGGTAQKDSGQKKKDGDKQTGGDKKDNNQGKKKSRRRGGRGRGRSRKKS